MTVLPDIYLSCVHEGISEERQIGFPRELEVTHHGSQSEGVPLTLARWKRNYNEGHESLQSTVVKLIVTVGITKR